MTYDNIKEEVLALGFVEDFEDEGRFLLALNRASNLLASEFPKRKTLLLSHQYVPPKQGTEYVGGEGLSLMRGEIVSFLYRRLDGAVGFDEKTLPLPSGTGTYTYTAETDGILTLQGDAEVYAVAVYPEGTPLSLCEVNLPYTEYDISLYAPMARMISAPPRTVAGEDIEGASVEGLCIRLPREYRGIFLVQYEKSPESIRQGRGEIEIEERLFPLFALLVCAYLWLEDEPERAQYYMALYREGCERMKAARPTYTEKRSTDVLGWT